MKPKLEKAKKRALIVIGNTANSLVSPFTNILLSLIVIKLYGGEFWGRYVYYLLYSSLAVMILAWGNKEFLLREYSKDPAVITNIWFNNFLTRLPLILPVFVIFVFSFSLNEVLLITGWVALWYILISFETLIVYYRRFLASVFAEILSSFVLFFLVFIYKDVLEIYAFVILCYVYYATKITLLVIIFRKELLAKGKVLTVKFFDLKILKLSFIFFLLGVTGMLGSRIDQYVVAYYMPRETLGEYQILKNFLLYCQSLTVFLIYPFVKNIYRFKDEQIRNLNRKMVLSGLALTVPLTAVIWMIMSFVYQISFSTEIYILSALFILPPFCFLVILYRFFKLKKENLVLLFNCMGIAISFTLSTILIPDLGITGCLAAGTVSGWVLVVLYFIYDKKLESN